MVGCLTSAWHVFFHVLHRSDFVHTPGKIHMLNPNMEMLKDDVLFKWQVLGFKMHRFVVCLFVCLFVSFFLSFFVCFFVCLFVSFFLSLFLCFFLSLFFCLFVSFFLSLFLCLFVCLFVGISIPPTFKFMQQVNGWFMVTDLFIRSYWWWKHQLIFKTITFVFRKYRSWCTFSEPSTVGIPFHKGLTRC